MIQLSFKPVSEEFKLATEDYQNIWNKEGEIIIKTFEEVTGLSFKQKSIDVIVYEGPSFSGKLNTPMKLRASYSTDLKRGTIVHELGHRLIVPLHNRIEGIDEHRTLNLFLYDVWVKLYGEEFANEMVSAESKRTGLYDYKTAWKWFGVLSKSEKIMIWQNFLNLNKEQV
jgi:hypothetical protein